MGALVVGTRDQVKIQAIAKLSKGLLSYAETMSLLGVSERTVRRWLRSYEQKGLSFLRHGNSGKIPVNKINNAFKTEIMRYMEAELYDFNMTHALEKIEEKFNCKVNRETFRRWCHERGMVKQAHKSRRSRPRYKRPRFARYGFMLQLDGSPHRWFGDNETCLIAAIDDATSEVLGGEFFPTETMFGTFSVLTSIFKKHGLPCVIYVDRAGMYGGQKRTNFSQLVRALEELNIQIIYANSPEGKGRIERLFRTLQDRLIPEMRLKGVAAAQEANHFFNEIYLPHLHNPRFAVQAQETNPAWRPLLLNQKLEDIFCIKERRRVARDHTFSYQGAKYLITSDLKYSIYKHDIELKINAKNEMKAHFAGRELSFIKITKCPKRMAS